MIQSRANKIATFSKLANRKCQQDYHSIKTPVARKAFELRHLCRLLFAHSVVSVAIYIIMIEGLGKGVKYSLFVANAIIFVSSAQVELIEK